MFDSLGDTTELRRVVAYEKLVATLPKLMGNVKAKSLLGSFLSECYALESSEPAAAPLRNWSVNVNQIPRDNAVYPQG